MADSLIFDGFDDVVSVSPGQIIGTGALTYAAVVKIADQTYWNTMVHYNALSGFGFQVRADTQKMAYTLGAAFSDSSFTVLSSEGWVLLAYTKPAGSAVGTHHKYVFGTGVWTHGAGNTALASPAAPTVIHFGGNPTDGDFFNGTKLLTAIWDRELADLEVEALSPGLKAWIQAGPKEAWRFDTMSPIRSQITTSAQTARTGTTLNPADIPVGWTDSLNPSAITKPQQTPFPFFKRRPAGGFERFLVPRLHYDYQPPVVNGAADLTGVGSSTSAGVHTAVGVAALTGTGSSTTAGVRTRLGVAALTGTGSSTSAGAHTAFAAAALTGAGSSTTAGVRTRLGAAALTGTGSSTTAGVRTRLSAATLTGTGSSTTAGVRTRFAATALTGAGTAITDGYATKTGAADLTGSGSSTAAGTRTRFATSTLIGAGTLAAAGDLTAQGSAALAGNGALTTDGTRVRFGAATLAGTGASTAAGVRTRLGAADLTGTGTLSATAEGTAADVTGSADLTGLGSLAAAGDVESASVIQGGSYGYSYPLHRVLPDPEHVVAPDPEPAAVYASARLTGTGTLSATGVRTIVGQAELAAVTFARASGIRATSGAAELAASTSGSASGTRTVYTAAALAATVTVSLSGYATMAADARLHASSAADASGTRTVFSGARFDSIDGTATATGNIRLGKLSLEQELMLLLADRDLSYA